MLIIFADQSLFAKVLLVNTCKDFFVLGLKYVFLSFLEKRFFQGPDVPKVPLEKHNFGCPFISFHFFCNALFVGLFY